MISYFRVRKAVEKDILNLSVLKKQVFISTYAVEGIRQDFSEYVTSEFSVEKLQTSLNSENKITLVAEHNTSLLGCLEIDFDSRCKQSKDESPELTVLYVFEHAKDKGVGYTLISEAEKIIYNKKFPGLWLTVYHQNKNAVKFYERQNYKDIGMCYFKMGGKKHENRIMFKQL